METADAMAEETFLPILDLSLVDDGADGDAKAFAAALHDAFVHSGFCYITNHGVPDAVIEADELRKVMRQEMKKLPERERTVLVLYYEENLTLGEIGDVLGVTESRVSQIHTKAVLQMRARLRAADVG